MSTNQCRVCTKNINPAHHYLKCYNCKLNVHKKCNKLNDLDYKLLRSHCSIWFCIICTDEMFPFSNISDHELRFIYSSNIIADATLPSDLNLFPSPSNNKHFTKFNDFFISQSIGSCDIENDLSANPINCKYFNIDEFCSSNFDSNNSFSVFHMNISSINAHFEDLTAMLTLLNFNFSLIGLTETST